MTNSHKSNDKTNIMSTLSLRTIDTMIQCYIPGQQPQTVWPATLDSDAQPSGSKCVTCADARAALYDCSGDPGGH